jgi:hypothetical protein
VVLLVIFTYEEKSDPLNLFTGSKKAPETEEAGLIKDNKAAISRAMDNSMYMPVPLISESDHLEGEMNALVQMIIYDDYSSELSYIFGQTMDQAAEKFDGSLLAAFRHFPSSGDDRSLMASLAVECAHEQENFWPMREAVLAGSASKEIVFGKDEILAKAEELKLDMEKFTLCLDNQVYKDRIQRDINGAKEAGVAGSPTVFINGAAYNGALPFEDFTDSSGEERPGLRSLIEYHLEMLSEADTQNDNDIQEPLEEELTE